MTLKVRLFVLGALSLIGIFSFRADETGSKVLPTTETPRLRINLKEIVVPPIEKSEVLPIEKSEVLPIEKSEVLPTENVKEIVVPPINRVIDTDIPLHILLANTSYNPYAEIAMHAGCIVQCLTQCERRIFDAYIR